MRAKLRMLVAVGAALILLGSSAATGANTVGRDFRISGPRATADEVSPAVAHNETTNQYLVVWQDDRNYETRGHDIYGRRIGADGRPILPDFRISGPQATDNEVSPAVAWNQTTNQYLVVWEEHVLYDGAYLRSDIRGRRIRADGTPAGAEFRISAGTSHERSPAVAHNQTTNQYLVVWRDLRNVTTTSWDIYGRRVGAVGKLIGPEFRISDSGGLVHDEDPAVAYNTITNQYLVVWENSDGIQGRRVGSRSKPLRGGFTITGAGAKWARDPAVAWSRAVNRYLVVWTDFRTEPTRKTDIYGRRVGAGGRVLGADTRIGGPMAIEFEANPAVAWNQTANQYLVVWQDKRNDDTRGFDVYARSVKTDGRPTGGEIRIGGPRATSDEVFPAVACNATDNQYLVVWSDHRSEPARGTEIYGRRLAG